MCDFSLVNLANTGNPPIHVTLTPAGQACTMRVTLEKDGDQAGNDWTGDTFTAAVQSTDIGDDGQLPDAIAVNVVATYDPTEDQTLLVVEFPASDIPDAGKFGVRWESSETRWPLVGSYERKKLIP
jgi:hypothetical protein